MFPTSGTVIFILLVINNYIYVIYETRPLNVISFHYTDYQLIQFRPLFVTSRMISEAQRTVQISPKIPIDHEIISGHKPITTSKTDQETEKIRI